MEMYMVEVGVRGEAGFNEFGPYAGFVEAELVSEMMRGRVIALKYELVDSELVIDHGAVLAANEGGEDE